MSRLVRAILDARLGICCALVAVSLLFGASLARAQDECIPGSTEPETAPGPHGCPPLVYFNTTPGLVPVVSLELTVYWEATMNGLNAASRSILVGATNVTSSFSYDTIDVDGSNVILAMSTGIVTLPADGSPVTVTASICTSGPRCATPVTATYRYQTPPLVIAALNSVARPRNEPQLETFRVVNRWTSPLTYSVTAICNGVSCSPNVSQLTVGAGDTAMVAINYLLAPNSPSMGSVGVSVVDSTGGAFASTSWVAMVSAGPPGGVGDRADLSLNERSMCVTASVGAGAAYECGDLRLVHALPTTRVLNKARTPVLIYNSQHGRPTPIVAAHVSRELSLAPPDSLRAVLTVANVTVASRWYRGTIADTVRRVALSFDASSKATGVYDYTLEVTQYSAGASPTVIHERSGRLAIVNRVNSPFGRGWWLAGLETIVPISEEELLWVGGDGSTRRYTQTYDGTGWAGPFFDRPDTIRPDPSGGYKRPLPGGDTVFFNAAGRHVKTRTARRDSTMFTYADSTLTQIALPAGTVGGTPLVYGFSYTGGSAYATPGMLAEVIAPSTDGTSNLARVVRLETIGRNVTRIWDPLYRQDSPVNAAFDYGKPHLSFETVDGHVVSRSSRDSVPTFYRYANGGLLSDVALALGPGDSIKVAFRPAESQGLTVAERDTAVYTRINGPRTDVLDYTRFYLDRWGAPVKVVDALGAATTLRRGHTTLPALVTSVRYANNREVSASYDTRGNLMGTTDHSMVSSGRAATTVYDYDPRFDRIRRVTQPEGEISTTTYDAYGRPEWVQQGPSASRRVGFLYNSLTTAATAGPGLVQAVRLPATVSQAESYQQFEYDALGNTQATVSPGLVRSEALADAAGRTTRVRTQIDTSSVPKFQVDSTTYDINDRAVRTESLGPQVTAGARTIAQQRMIVRNEYDVEGRIRAVIRRPETNEAGVDSLITRWRYDRAGRSVAEYAPDATPAVPFDGPRDSTVYNSASLAEKVITRRGDTLTTVYDVLNRPTSRTVTAYTYQPRWQGIAALHPNYCAAGPPYDIRHPYPAQPTNSSNCTYLVAADTTTFSYDVIGNLKTATNRDARVSRSYYLNGLIKGDTLRIRTTSGATVDDTHKYVLDYQYDLNGRRRVLTHPSQLGPTATATTQYGYNPETGGLETVTDPLGNVFSYNYDGRGQLRTLSLPGNVVHGYSYDREGRMDLYTLDVPGQGVGGRISQTHYSYDARGKLLASHNDVGARDDFTAAYSGIGHLVTSAHSTTGVTQGFNVIFERNTADYWNDAMGNGYQTVTGSGSQERADRWMLLNGSAGSWGTSGGASTYEATTGRLLTSTQASGGPAGSFTQSFVYDASGNTVFQQGNNGTNKSDVAHFYSGDGKLRAVDRRDSDHTGDVYTAVWEEYRYDPLGRRVWVHTRYECGFSEPRCAINPVRRTIWDGDQALYEIQMQEGEAENDGTPTFTTLLAGGLVDPRTFTGRVLHTYGPGIDQPLSVIRMGYVGRDPFAVMPLWDSDGRAPYLVFANGGRCHASGCGLNTVWAVGNRPYGSKANGYVYADGDLTNRYVWLGNIMQDQHDASGLLYRRNRYYDAQTGRFTQEDPIGLAGGVNLYGFADADPVSYGDPYGLKGCTLRDPITCISNIIHSHYKLGDIRHAFGHMVRGSPRDQRVLGVLGRVTLTANRLTDARASRYSADQQNAFRHIYASCSLTRELGPREAAETTNAHEQTLHRASPDEAADSRADQVNNQIGRTEAMTRKRAIDTCERIADEHVTLGDFASP